MSWGAVGFRRRLVVLAVLAAAPANLGCATPASTGRSGGAPDANRLLVKVVDENGAPIAGAVVSGRYPVNPGITASTCCAPAPRAPPP